MCMFVCIPVDIHIKRHGIHRPTYVVAKLQVSFEKESYKRDYILQKRPIVLRSLLTVATPYVWHDTCVISRLLKIIGLF